MTPKEKAAELIEKYRKCLGISRWHLKNDHSLPIQCKKCAIILCDEFINAMRVTHIGMCKDAFNSYYKKKSEYWQSVKKEIEILC